MNSNFFTKLLRWLFFPISILYGLIIKVRNFLYNKNLFHSTKFDIPIICIGNLSVGGTGKSPMVQYLINQFQSQNNIAILSRGYGRKTKGYIFANSNASSYSIGDEPFMFYSKNKNINIAVCENRVEGVNKLIQDAPNTNLIVLDDAFQHRAIKANCNIVLTDFSNLYCSDFFLPTGNLRDDRQSIKRANIVIVSKCPVDLSFYAANKLTQILKLPTIINLFFTTINYQLPTNLQNTSSIDWENINEVLLVTGIANPTPIENLLQKKEIKTNKLIFKDHHNFTKQDIATVKNKFLQINSNKKIILTTEKDAMRLVKYTNDLNELPIYYLPIQTKFLFENENDFLQVLNNNIKEYRSKINTFINK